VRSGGKDRSLRRYVLLSFGAVVWVGVMLRLGLGASVPGADGEATKVAILVAAILLWVLALPMLFRAGRDGRREAIKAHRSHSRLPSDLGDSSTVMWTTDGLLRLMHAMGGGLGPMGLASGRVDGMPLAEFFKDLRPDSSLVTAHRRALGGETVSCAFNCERTRFGGVVHPLRRDGRIVGVVGVATEQAVGSPRRVEAGTPRVIDLTNFEEEEAETGAGLA